MLAIVFAAMLGASGDLVCEEGTAGVLTSPQRTQLATLLTALWPGAITDLYSVVFTRNTDNTVAYSLSGERTFAPAAAPVGTRIVRRLP